MPLNVLCVAHCFRELHPHPSKDGKYLFPQAIARVQWLVVTLRNGGGSADIYCDAHLLFPRQVCYEVRSQFSVLQRKLSLLSIPTYGELVTWSAAESVFSSAHFGWPKTKLISTDLSSLHYGTASDLHAQV